MKVIVLAAGIGKRFGKRTKTIPKCLIQLDREGNHLLSRYLRTFLDLDLRDITIVVGHKRHLIEKACEKWRKHLNIHFLFNKKYRQGSVLSLHRAKKVLRQGALIMDADVFFLKRTLEKLLRSKNRSAFLVDRNARSTGEEMMLMAKRKRPFAISKKPDPGLQILGESIGFLKLDSKDAPILCKILEDLVRQGFTHVEYEESYNRFMKEKRVGVVSIGDAFWTEMDFEHDLEKIRKYLRTRSE